MRLGPDRGVALALIGDRRLRRRADVRRRRSSSRRSTPTEPSWCSGPVLTTRDDGVDVHVLRAPSDRGRDPQLSRRQRGSDDARPRRLRGAPRTSSSAARPPPVLTCFRAANVVLRFEEMDPADRARIVGAVRSAMAIWRRTERLMRRQNGEGRLTIAGRASALLVPVASADARSAGLDARPRSRSPRAFRPSTARSRAACSACETRPPGAALSQAPRQGPEAPRQRPLGRFGPLGGPGREPPVGRLLREGQAEARADAPGPAPRPP